MGGIQEQWWEKQLSRRRKEIGIRRRGRGHKYEFGSLGSIGPLVAVLAVGQSSDGGFNLEGTPGRARGSAICLGVRVDPTGKREPRQKTGATRPKQGPNKRESTPADGQLDPESCSGRFEL